MKTLLLLSSLLTVHVLSFTLSSDYLKELIQASKAKG